MVKSVHIHSLIHSLSSSEKGYIKKYLNINASSNKKIVQLFDLVEKQKEQHTEELRQKYSAKNFDEALEVLFDTILTCIENYHSSEKKEIRSLLNRIEILAEKNLYQQAEKLVIKVKALTEKNKFYDLYSEVAEWEISLLGPKPPTDELIKTYDKIFDKLEVDITEQEMKLSSSK